MFGQLFSNEEIFARIQFSRVLFLIAFLSWKRGQGKPKTFMVLCGGVKFLRAIKVFKQN
jgi:hypothetical protein